MVQSFVPLRGFCGDFSFSLDDVVSGWLELAGELFCYPGDEEADEWSEARDQLSGRQSSCRFDSSAFLKTGR
ncbi:MAG: hypothetical protein AAF989_12735 [Planctomycetota bacterium]